MTAPPPTLDSQAPLSAPCCSFSLSLKPVEAPEVDEDEGFSDWSQRPEQRHHGAGETSDRGEPPQEQQEDRQVGARAWRGGRQAGGFPKLPACACTRPSTPLPSQPPKAPPWL